MANNRYIVSTNYYFWCGVQYLICSTVTPMTKWNEMNRALGHLCAHIGWTGPGEPPEDGVMIEMTLSSRHRIRNSSPGGLRPSTLPLGHGGSPQYWLSHVDGEETFFVSFKPPRPGTEPWTLAWKAAVLTTTLGPPPNPHDIALANVMWFAIPYIQYWTPTKTQPNNKEQQIMLII